jgi:hypothetical protein
VVRDPRRPAPARRVPVALTGKPDAPLWARCRYGLPGLDRAYPCVC